MHLFDRILEDNEDNFIILLKKRERKLLKDSNIETRNLSRHAMEYQFKRLPIKASFTPILFKFHTIQKSGH